MGAKNIFVYYCTDPDFYQQIAWLNLLTSQFNYSKKTNGSKYIF